MIEKYRRTGRHTYTLEWQAFVRLRYLGVDDVVLEDFKNSGRVWISDASSPSHSLALNPVDDELQEKILELQKETGGLVYHVIRNMYDSRARYTGIIDSFLIAMPGKPLFPGDVRLIDNGMVPALIVNEDAPDGFYSALVYVKPEHGGLDRSNSTFDYKAFHKEMGDTVWL